jgi:hypothetical protein
VHQTSSKHTFTSRHDRISNRCLNQKEIAGKNRAHSSRNRAGTSGQEAERIQEPRHAQAADIRKVKRVITQCMAHSRDRESVTRQQIKPQIGRIQALRRGSLAAEEETLDAAPAVFHKGVLPSSIWWWRGDADLAVRTRAEPMQRQGVSQHNVKAILKWQVA